MHSHGSVLVRRPSKEDLTQVIGALTGTVIDRRADTIIFDVRDVGYEVFVTSRFVGGAEQQRLWVHHHVREDTESLFGFSDRDERDLFAVLLTASGVGPKLALAILSALTPAQLRSALAGDDVAQLTLVPGIGKRTAQRLIVDLKTKVTAREADLGGSSTALTEVRLGLESLGYTTQEVAQAVAGLDPSQSVEVLMRIALSRIGGRDA